MDTCCEVRPVSARQRGVLQAALWINAAMFVVESAAGLAANSTALLADSVDMLGDAIVYGFSLYAIDRGLAWQSRGRVPEGIDHGGLRPGDPRAGGVKLTRGPAPGVETMGIVGLVALVAKFACLRAPLAPPRRRHQHALGEDLLA